MVLSTQSLISKAEYFSLYFHLTHTSTLLTCEVRELLACEVRELVLKIPTVLNNGQMDRNVDGWVDGWQEQCILILMCI